jgi:class 3 adenylate cyclase
MTALPGGTVTFLFSDIEGSTRLVKALRERYTEVLAEHRLLVRAAGRAFQLVRAAICRASLTACCGPPSQGRP